MVPQKIMWISSLLLIAALGCKRAPEVSEEVPQAEEVVVVEEKEKAPAEQVSWKKVEVEELDEAGQAKLAKADEARQALASRLVGRVMEVSQAEGFPAAVDVCHGEASVITAEVAREHGVKIGRTSEKLRNRANTGVAWAEPFYNEAGTPAVVVASNGALGTLNPIRLAAACVNCHGAKDQLAPGVTEVLVAKYPEDQATGYAAGDLRGWFWVEVP